MLAVRLQITTDSPKIMAQCAYDSIKCTKGDICSIFQDTEPGKLLAAKYSLRDHSRSLQYVLLVTLLAEK